MYRDKEEYSVKMAALFKEYNSLKLNNTFMICTNIHSNHNNILTCYDINGLVDEQMILFPEKFIEHLILTQIPCELGLYIHLKADLDNVIKIQYWPLSELATRTMTWYAGFKWR